MAVTNQDSTQVANPKASPPVVNHSSDDGGRVRTKYFNFTQTGAGDATSIANLVRLPGGKVRILSVYIAWAAMGAARTMDLGFTAHSDPDGEAVAVDPDAYDANRDVSAAGAALVQVNKSISTRDGVLLTAQINDGTFDNGKTLEGYVLLAAD